MTMYSKLDPYPDERFNKVFTVNTIYFWNNPIEDLKEIRRVLKTDGQILLLEIHEKSGVSNSGFIKLELNLGQPYRIPFKVKDKLFPFRGRACLRLYGAITRYDFTPITMIYVNKTLLSEAHPERGRFLPAVLQKHPLSVAGMRTKY